MDIIYYIQALEEIKTQTAQLQLAVSQVLGALKGESFKSKTSPAQSKQVSAVLMEGEEMRKYKGKTIKKRADGRYWTRYYRDGKQHSIYGQTINECLQNLKQALSGKKQLKAPSKQTTLGEWLQKWLELYKIGQVRDTTVQKIKELLRAVNNDLQANLLLQ